ncbi:MAG TPA: hypothetical protein VF469_00255, partial [Kofleriaceae bacterium]
MLRSRTSICTSSVCCACSLAVALGACRQGTNAIAELTAATGPVQREEGEGPWQPAKLGTRYFLHDAARTGDGTATLEVGGAGGAKILMKDHTVLRFGGTPGQGKISVEDGAIDLSGTGSYALDIGDVKLAEHGTVRITSKGNGRSSVELTIGQGQVAANGETFVLSLGKSVDVGSGAPAPADAGVRDAPVPAIDAAVPDAAEAAAAADATANATADATADATIEVTGRRAELLAPGETAWKPLPAGAGPLARGSGLRLGPGTT